MEKNGILSLYTNESKDVIGYDTIVKLWDRRSDTLHLQKLFIILDTCHSYVWGKKLIVILFLS